MTTQLSEQTKSLSVRPRLIVVAWKYRMILLGGLAAGMVLGLFMAMTRPTTYTTSTTILFPPAPASKLSALTGGGGDADLPPLPLLDGALSVPQPGTSTSTAGILLQSRQVVSKVAGQLNLQQVWQLPNEAKVLKQFHRKLECRAGKNSDLTIVFQDKSRELAYQVVEQLVKELDEQSLKLGLNPARKSVDFLQEQLAKAELKWAKAQRNLMLYSQEHRIISFPDQARGLANQYSEIERELTTARITSAAAFRQVDMQSDIARKLVDACVDPVTTANTPTPLAELYQKVKAVESDLVLLRDRLAPGHPEIKDKQLALDEVKRRLKIEVERQMALLNNGSSPAVAAAVVQAAAGQASVDGLQAAQQRVLQEIDTLPLEQATYARLATEVEAGLLEVKLFREELEKARIIAARNDSNFIIVDPPAPALERDPAYRMLTLMVMMMLGLCLAALFPYVEWSRQQVEYKEEKSK